jgi:hypothetical protein
LLSVPGLAPARTTDGSSSTSGLVPSWPWSTEEGRQAFGPKWKLSNYWAACPGRHAWAGQSLRTVACQPTPGPLRPSPSSALAGNRATSATVRTAFPFCIRMTRWSLDLGSFVLVSVFRTYHPRIGPLYARFMHDIISLFILNLCAILAWPFVLLSMEMVGLNWLMNWGF